MDEPFRVVIPRVHAHARGMALTDVMSVLAVHCHLLDVAPDGRRYLRLDFGRGDVVDIYEGDRLTSVAASSIWLHWWTLVRSTDFRIPEDAPPWPMH